MKKNIIALIPVIVLIALLAFDISILGSDSIQGASQVSLLFASGIAVWLAMWRFKKPWSAFEDAIKANIGNITSAIVILLLIGAISGTWTMSGIVPTMICYGVKVLSPSFFLPAACIICAAVSLMLGSSWTTIATIGVALLGIGKAEGFHEGLIAGAIISGAYFGDKISPLSDTTVLASSIAETPLFSHIRYMMITTVPSFAITLIAFTVIGLVGVPESPADMGAFTGIISAKFRSDDSPQDACAHSAEPFSADGGHHRRDSTAGDYPQHRREGSPHPRHRRPPQRVEAYAGRHGGKYLQLRAP